MEPLSRVTPATIDVLSVLDEATDATWGLAIIKSSGRPAGTVYPILDRLEQTGWVTSKWEDDPARSGPRRRFYKLTDAGVAGARQAIVAFRSRSVRRAGVTATGGANS